MMEPFAKRHPFLILLYYVLAMALLLVMGHPVLYGIAVGILFFNRCIQIGGKKSLRLLFYSIGTCALCLVINPLCNHRGVTLVYQWGEMRITKEAILYGGHMALLLLGSLLLFSCFSYYMTAQNIMTLTGRIFPSFSMLFTMILRVVPKVQKDFHQMTELNGHGPKVWSALLGVEMEDSIERSIAMRQKEYGEHKRTHYFRKKMLWQDWFLLLCLCFIVTYLFLIMGRDDITVRYFPSIYVCRLTGWDYGITSIYMAIPILLRGKEECKWFLWKQRITNSIIRNKSSQLLK